MEYDSNIDFQDLYIVIFGQNWVCIAKNEFTQNGTKNSLKLTLCSPEADYVNTDIINELIKEQDISNGSSNSRHHQHHPNAAILERPKSVAEISQKENGCVIKIKGDEVSYNFSKRHIIVCIAGMSGFF